MTKMNREDIVGSSPKLRACLALAAQAAGSDVPVLVSGETGTGKEVFARAIHRNSARAGGSFIVADCPALPSPLGESLLFGHEKGTFTGASADREGLMGQAHGGTLFLDEIGELSYPLQSAFLRALQCRRYRPLGSPEEVVSDFRLVAATHRDLDRLVRTGAFRMDLYLHLRSLVIELPPLRERHEDLPDLVRYFADRFCAAHGLASKAFSPEFLKTLRAYPWPGNVRELSHAVEYAVGAARLQSTLFPQHLPNHIRITVAKVSIGHLPPSEGVTPSPPRHLPKLQDFRESIYQTAERTYLHDLMSFSKKNIRTACRQAGLSQSRLYALLKKHGISRL